MFSFDENNKRRAGIRALLLVTAIVAVLGIIITRRPDSAAAILVIVVISGFFLVTFRGYTSEKEFVTKIFLIGLALRLAFGVFIEIADLRGFFGGDANTYDYRGTILRDVWFGVSNVPATDAAIASSTSGSGWGMHYLVAAIYTVLGRNLFAAQSFCAVVGAATAPMVFYCANKVYENLRVAKLAAILVAIFPAFIIWSSQLLKDGLIIFLLVLAMTMVFELQEKVRLSALLLLGLSLAGILSLRFYIFYMVVIAVAGSFIIGVSNSAVSTVTRLLVLVILGLGLTYFGVIRTASGDLEKYGSLERVQVSRRDQATRAESGFGSDADVSTANGALTVIPIGFAYLMLAPFPWETRNLRQAITLPEVLVWWSMVPLLLSGLIYSVKHRLRNALPILLFSFLLTLAYSIFQSNVGTAYRQRTQIQVFLFIFVAVGWVLLKEKRENVQLERRRRREMFEASLKDRMGGPLPGGRN